MSKHVTTRLQAWGREGEEQNMVDTSLSSALEVAFWGSRKILFSSEGLYFLFFEMNKWQNGPRFLL